MGCRFSPIGNGHQLKAQFKARRRQTTGEALARYCDELRRLVMRAYTTMTPDNQGELLRDQFIHGLPPSNLRLRVMENPTFNVDEALEFSTQSTPNRVCAYLWPCTQARAPYGFLGDRNPTFFFAQMQDFASFFEKFPGDAPGTPPPLKGTGARAWYRTSYICTTYIRTMQCPPP